MKHLLVLSLCLAASLADDADVEQFAAGTKLFTEALYRELIGNSNILVSPFSIETIFGLTQSGAVGTTGQEIRNSLFLPDTKEATDSIFKSVLSVIRNDGYTLRTANKVYVNNDFSIKESFSDVATDVYKAEFQNIEFSENVAAAAEINQWVKKQTENKIEEVINSDALDAHTRLVLINALYFKGNFSQPFDADDTKTSHFFLTRDVVIEADMMFSKSKLLNFYESEELDAKFLELPFSGNAASLTIVLPNKLLGIAALERQLGAALTTPEYTPELVQVSLPKFKIEATINLAPILEKLGIRHAFDPVAADFSGISGRGIVIDKVVQKTYIDVNERGVEAAAATGVAIKPGVTVKPTQEFNANHPFIFYIKAHNIILFQGRVGVPRQ